MDRPDNQNKTRTRIAPSPTGEDIHIGNLYTALINYTVAKKNDGAFIIRIEDTDRQRLQEGAEQKILSSIKAFGLTYAEGPDIGGPFAPYKQSERLEKYKAHVEELIKKGAAYYCFCTKERLTALREQQIEEKKTPRYDKHCLGIKNQVSRINSGEPYVIRLNVVGNRQVRFTDIIRGEIVINTNEIDDQVLLKSDGYPTYHLGVVVDDRIMEISHIIRAEEWISSTPKHVLLYEAFGWELPVFAHLPILRNPDKSKLSKRKNPVWASWYLEEGFLPEAVLNYLALLGWSHPEQKEKFSLQEFIDLFELKDVHPAGPIFDLTKLRWMNQQYIQSLKNEELKQKLLDFYKEDKVIHTFLSDDSRANADNVEKVLDLVKTRMETLKDFKALMSFVFTPPDPSGLAEEHKEVVPQLLSALENIPHEDWKSEKIFNAMKKIMEEKRTLKMPVFYVVFTGDKRGLPLPDMLEVMEKDEVLKRLRAIG